MIPADTIVAISTPPGMGAIAVVRLSGPASLSICSQIFSVAKPGAEDCGEVERLSASAGDREARTAVQEPASLAANCARVGFIKDPETGSLIDEVVVIPYKAPRTYTGEDLVEINCHGGWLVPNEILALCLKLGARLARPGEFTERAFLSGRIDLTQAEAVLDLIQAKTSRQGRLAVSALAGQLGRRIEEVRSRLVDLMAAVVAGIDFPEEVGEASSEEIYAVVQSSLETLETLSATARSGRFLREGLRVAIVGRPNAGKSSLLNQLLKFERAIVTDTPGTTRDSLEELLDVNGVPVILVDTAGIRRTDDQVEKIGIERAIAAINQADLVLLVVDLLAGWSSPEEEIVQLIGSTPYILVGNKVDLAGSTEAVDPRGFRPGAYAQAIISATSGVGLPELTGLIEQWVFAGQPERAGAASLNARQSELCLRAVNALRLVQEALAQKLPQDCLSTDLKGAVDALSEMSGEVVSEEVIHKVFANFCIGK